VTAKFVVNNKTYSVAKISLFITNYSGELRMEVYIRKKRKLEKVINVTTSKTLGLVDGKNLVLG